MHESTTYEAILRKGREEGFLEGRIEVTRRLLILAGTKRFAKPSATCLAAIEEIRDVERLEALCERIIDPDVRDWNSLVGAS